MFALPLITGITAPQAARAASNGIAPGSRTLEQSCRTSTDCASAAPNCRTVTSAQICCTNSTATFASGDHIGDIGYAELGDPVTCASAPDGQKNQMCNTYAGSRCCSGRGKYTPNTCRNTTASIIRFDCECL